MIEWLYEGQYEESTNIGLQDSGGSTLMINSTSEIGVNPDGQLRESGACSGFSLARDKGTDDRYMNTCHGVTLGLGT
jgi:hypothetical protein